MNELSKKQHMKAGRWMIYAAWVMIFAILVWFFGIVETEKRNPNQQVHTDVLSNGNKEVVLKSSTHGHYFVTGKINNEDVTFLIDTGASFVSIPGKVAKNLNLEKGAPLLVSTANGEITVYATLLSAVSIGDIILHNIKADINPHMRGKEILLGMSFLRYLSVTHEDNQLIIRQ